MGNHSGRRMLSLDSSAPQMAGGRVDWLRTQQILGQQFCFLFTLQLPLLSCRSGRSAEKAQTVVLEQCERILRILGPFRAAQPFRGKNPSKIALQLLFKVVGVCLFLHSFVPKEFYVNQQQQQQAVQQGQDDKSSRTIGSYSSQMNAETLHGNGAIISYKVGNFHKHFYGT